METNKSYTEIKEGYTHNWNSFLDHKKTVYSHKELLIAKARAKDWVTCAVGSQCSIIPREENGKPLDAKLQRIGLEFANFVISMYHHYLYNNFDDFRSMKINAKDALTKIENRSAQLIKEITNGR